ncbi:hypothetical protein PJP08_29285, partial [Mycobacterium kansasii]
GSYTSEFQQKTIQENSLQNSIQNIELIQQNTLQRFQELVKDVQQWSSRDATMENSAIENEELDCVDEHMVQFPDESISMTVQKNN